MPSSLIATSSFGAQHDGYPFAKECTDMNYVMAPEGGYFEQEDVKKSLRFSKCSVKMIKHYVSQLDKYDANCLKQQVNPGSVMDTSNIKAGSGLSLDEVRAIILLNPRRSLVELHGR